MFEMSASVKIEGLKAFTPSSLFWENTAVSYVNSARVVLPSRCMFDGVPTKSSNIIKEGAKIEFSAGYNGVLTPRFIGFVARVNAGVPVELSCEGYSYQLRQVTNFTKSYKDTTVADVLSDLIADTDIVLSDLIPDIPLAKVEFIRLTGRDVLEWLQDKALLTVRFIGHELYVGLEQHSTANEVKLQLGWNTAQDKDLTFDPDKGLADVKITLEAKKPDGTKAKSSSTGTNEKVLKTIIQDEAAQAIIAEQQRKELASKGYDGMVTAFLVPDVSAGDTVQITDAENTDRSGNYFCSSISGTYSKSGGRQKVKLSYIV